jgi:hypothetical protein
MNSREIRSLQEAYMGLYEERNPSHPHWQTNTQFKKSQKRNQELIDATTKRREDRARNKNPIFIGKGGKITKTQREQTELYDIILSHLLDEGYANTLSSAEAIMVSMSEGWLQNIVEGGTRREPSLVGQATDLAKARQRLARHQSDVDANTQRGGNRAIQTQYDRRGQHKLNRGRRGDEQESPNPVRRWARHGEPGGPG